MLKFEENLASRVSGALQPMLGVQVTVTASNGLLATLYADDESTVLANPVTTDANGYFGFKAANGEYTLTFAGAQIETATRKVELYDADDDPPFTLAQAATPTAASRIGFRAAGEGAQGRTIENKLQEAVSVKDFGAVGDGVADDSAAIQAAIDSGAPLFFPAGTYLLSAKLTSTQQVSIRGDGKTRTTLLWQSGSGQEGIEVTPSSWDDTISIRDLSLLTKGNATDTAIRVNWRPLGAVGIPYFDRRACLDMLRISGVSRTLNGWRVGIEFDFPFAVDISNCEIFGKYTVNAKLPADFVSGSVGVHVPDQAIRTLVGFCMTNTVIMGFASATLIYNVEGYAQQGCDFQVCYDGLDIRNTITKVNQYRIRGNHFGTTGCQFRVQNARQVLFTANEVSYRNGRTDGGTETLIELDGVYSAVVSQNSIRGNVFNDTSIIVDGIAFKWDHKANETDFTRRIVVEGNCFQALRNAMRNDAGANVQRIAHGGNSFDSIRGKILAGTVTTGFTELQRIGSGDFEIGSPASSNTALHIVNTGASTLMLDRQGADGATQVLKRDGVVVGSINTTATATTYATTSDERLKVHVALLDEQAALETIRQIKIHLFKWSAYPESDADCGVFAQELHAVYPRAVIVGHGNPGDDDYMPWSVDYSKLVPLLIAALRAEK